MDGPAVPAGARPLPGPEDFQRLWGAERLVRLPAEAGAMAPSLPDRDRSFLERAGLPACLRYDFGVARTVMTFCRLARGGTPLLQEPTVGPPPPRAWAVYRIIGDELFCNGSAWWCLHAPTGRVDRIDIALTQPVDHAASSVAHFAALLLAMSRWSASVRPVLPWPAALEALERDLRTVDLVSLEAPGNFWSDWLVYLRDEGPERGLVEVGSRAEGEQALEAGPW